MNTAYFHENLPVTTRWKIYNYATSYTVELGETITENIFKPLFQEEMSDHVDVTLSPSLKPTVDLQRSEVNGRSLNTMTLLNQKSTLIPRSMDRHVSNLLNSLMGGFGK
ncbi:hypothetical protein CHS0354_010365 [Potamilus streckersoni]|uniref:Uncharacterized protein n=1 Tax=Potamilus streckersoni TaxID=2493646 RepID=A0AAE0TDP3_9BIVA|nr:hypothetical protein CHS0354_010365 [Potamilus streckersoni]